MPPWRRHVPDEYADGVSPRQLVNWRGLTGPPRGRRAPSSQRLAGLARHARSATMKHLFAIAVLSLAICGQALADPAGDERELTQLVNEFNAALVKADIAVLERILHEDYVHTRWDGTVEQRAQYLENRKARRVAFESLIADDIKVRLHGDTAVVTGRNTVKGQNDRGAREGQSRWTRVFVRRDGRWRLVAFHGSVLQKP